MPTITFFDDNADDRYAGHTFELIRCSWSAEDNCYIKDPNGDQWAIYPPGGKELSVFNHPMENFGTIKFD